MKTPNKTNYVTLLLTLIVSLLCVGCATTRSENGVSIQQERDWNPMNYIPFF